MSVVDTKLIVDTLTEMFPDAHCELDYQDLYQLTIAIILSAQTTDRSVNKITPNLFRNYPDFNKLANADFNTVYQLINSIGLAKTKTNNIIKLAQIIDTKYHGKVPNDYQTLITLPGIGSKTANALISEGFKEPGLAVDTHVKRVSNRLGLVNTDDVLVIEKTLKSLFDRNDWSLLHHQLIFCGRYRCKAINPDCDDCLLRLRGICQYDKNSKNINIKK